ncbi:hypothetical protein [Psychrobacillus sp. OK032]|uniref:hypothetical protein n=1 Tax=Psychrobacillus sp. OK032 TaxID=1884358 RepID=UPI0008CA7A03|nr:hypothetical protein [Psychrobacillus sp. OK032]SES30815.1 hypothetical protein SAMN05518872_107226 [Psychrobacillus sp. OK032]
MSDQYGNEQELLLKNLIAQLIEEQLDELKVEKKENDNSFIFLEHNTLNRLITYLLRNQTNRKNVEVVEDNSRLSQVKILEELDRIIVDNQQEFEEVITLLKEKL